jgi:hypothetical protein
MSKPKRLGIDTYRRNLLGTSESTADFLEKQRQKQMRDQDETEMKHRKLAASDSNYKIDPTLVSIDKSLNEMNKSVKEILRLLKQTRRKK